VCFVDTPGLPKYFSNLLRTSFYVTNSPLHNSHFFKIEYGYYFVDVQKCVKHIEKSCECDTKIMCDFFSTLNRVLSMCNHGNLKGFVPTFLILTINSDTLHCCQQNGHNPHRVPRTSFSLCAEFSCKILQ
jgi:hypothetical protein